MHKIRSDIRMFVRKHVAALDSHQSDVKSVVAPHELTYLGPRHASRFLDPAKRFFVRGYLFLLFFFGQRLSRAVGSHFLILQSGSLQLKNRAGRRVARKLA